VAGALNFLFRSPGAVPQPDSALVDFADGVRAVDARERPVHREAEVGIVPAHHQRIGLEGEVGVEQRELGGFLPCS